MQGMKAAPSLRSEQRTYLNMGTPDAPVWRLVGEGFSNFEISANPVTQERHYIHEKTGRTYSTGNAPSIAYELDEMPTDPVALYIARIHDEELVGDAAVVDIVNVKFFREGTEAGTYFAKRRSYSVVPDGEAPGAGGDVYTYSGNFNALGDAELGNWTEDKAAGYETGSFASRPPVTVPGAPTAVSVTPGNAQAVVVFSPPTETGGAPILSYTAVAAATGGISLTASGAGSPLTIAGLTNGTEYTVTVAARNQAGTGAASAGTTVTPTEA